MRSFRIALIIGLVFVGVAMSGCSTSQWKERADKETYAAIAEKAPDVPGMVEDYDIDTEPYLPLESLPINEEAPEFLGEGKAAEDGARIITLEQALELAFRNNRDYQNQREVLYLTALNLTLERYRFTPIFGAGGGAAYERSTTDVTKSTTLNIIAAEAPNLINDFGNLAGAPAELVSRYARLVDSFNAATGADQPRAEIMDERDVRGSTRVGVDLLLAGGAQIALDFTSNFLRFLTGDDRVSTGSALTGSITQPLLRGAGSAVVQERLTQQERNLLYQLRDFTRFRQEFAVRVASEYYQVLQSRDTVYNNHQGYLSFQRAVEREEVLVEYARSTKADLGRQQQALLGRQDSWIRSISQYLQDLDSFKILLALSTDSLVMLDPTELEKLSQDGIEETSLAPTDAVEVALATRLDLYNVQDELEDSGRQLHVAENALKADVSIFLEARANSTGQDNFQELDFQRAQWALGLDVDAPIDRKAERNSYRAALIDFERSQRTLELAQDTVKLEVRSGLRDLERARRNYEIAAIGVQLNEERVELETLKSELGRATALDEIDAQNDLINSRNSLTAALVSHKISQLEFWRDMGILYIKKNGQWEDPFNDDQS